MTRRRRALVLIGILHAAMAVNLLTRPAMPADPAAAILHEMLLPIWVRVALWAGVAAACIVIGLVGRGERLGWVLAVAMPAERAMSYLWSGLMWIVPGWPPGALSSWATATVWLVIGLLVRHIASWPEPEPREVA